MDLIEIIAIYAVIGALLGVRAINGGMVGARGTGITLITWILFWPIAIFWPEKGKKSQDELPQSKLLKM